MNFFPLPPMKDCDEQRILNEEGKKIRKPNPKPSPKPAKILPAFILEDLDGGKLQYYEYFCVEIKS